MRYSLCHKYLDLVMKYIKLKYIGIALALLFVIQITFTVLSMEGTIYGDEYVFIRLTQNLPDASTSSDWLLKDRPDLTSDINPIEFYHLAYDTEIWVHPLLPNYLMYPLFKVVNPTTPRVARSIPLVLIIITAFLIADIIRRKFGLTYAGLSFLPFIASMELLGGGIWLYNDCFMWVFFALSLWIIFVKPDSKWIYLTMVCMLMSKEVGLILVIPLMLAYYFQTHKLKRTFTLLLPTLALIGWQIQMGIVTGDMLYSLHHWQALKSGEIVGLASLQSYIRNYGVFYLVNWGGAFYLVLTLPGLIANIKNKKYWSFISLYIITLCCGIGWGFVPYQMFSMLFPGMIMTVLSFRLVLPELK